MRLNEFMGARRLAIVGIVGAVIALAGCAAPVQRTSQDVVRERAQARWDAMVKGDFKTAYGFMSPGSKATTTLDQWSSTLRAGFWKSAVVDQVVCEGPETCEVQSTIEYDYRGNRFKTPVRDVWIKESGDWWFLKQ